MSEWIELSESVTQHLCPGGRGARASYTPIRRWWLWSIDLRPSWTHYHSYVIGRSNG